MLSPGPAAGTCTFPSHSHILLHIPTVCRASSSLVLSGSTFLPSSLSSLREEEFGGVEDRRLLCR